ncbi:Major facilitator, sugar transporter-like, partial [Dillenia turbinata]
MDTPITDGACVGCLCHPCDDERGKSIQHVTTRRLGRKVSFGGTVSLFGALVNVVAMDLTMLNFGRILLGIGLGFSDQGLIEFAFPIIHHHCILVANIVNYFTNKIKVPLGRHVSLGGAAFPAFFAVSTLILPDTPIFMLGHAKAEQAHQLLCRTRGIDNMQTEVNDLRAAAGGSKRVTHPLKIVAMRKYRPKLQCPFSFPCSTYSQASILSCSLLLSSSRAPDLELVLLLCLLSSRICSVPCGRKRSPSLRRYPMLLSGYIVVAILIGWKFGPSEEVEYLPEWFPYKVQCCMYTFVHAFVWSWGPLGWLVPSEIFLLSNSCTIHYSFSKH